MRDSLLGRLLLPPTRPEPASAERQRQLGLSTAGVAATAALIDVALYFMLRHDPSVRQSALRFFATLNIPMLAASALLHLTSLRQRAALFGCVVLEATTMMVWIQLTGSVSSYFLIMAILLILFYRGAFGYWLGLACFVTVVVLHVGAVVLEQLHVIPPVSLFAAAPGAIYASNAYRLGALGSILWCDTFAFFGANYLVEALRQKDRELRHMRRDLDLAVQKAQIGRLSGHVLDGRYELGELLGRGGMGEVYQARRLSDGRELAVKVLLSDLGGDSTLRERFRREAEVIAQLPPEHVAGFVELHRSDGQDFLVMELLRGEDLGAVLRRQGRLAPAELLPIVSGMVAALTAAHARGIIHRDLKPPNVFVDTDGRVRLLDFGIARLLLAGESRTLTMAQVVLGTPGYLAPEQARGQHHEIGPHTDVFALGAIVYRALTGRGAFPSRDPVAAVYEALCYHPAPPSSLVPGLSDQVDAVLSLAMAKSIGDRYRDAPGFAADLALALDGKLPDEVKRRGRALAEAAPTAEATLATAAGLRHDAPDSSAPTVAGSKSAG